MAIRKKQTEETQAAASTSTTTKAKKTATTKTVKPTETAPKAVKKTSTVKEPKIGTVLEATEEQILLAQSIAQLQAEVDGSGVLEKMALISAKKEELIGMFHGGETQDLTISLEGGTQIKVSKPSTSATVDKEKVLGFMGKDNFLALATVGVTDARKYLTPEQQQKAISIKSGSRKVTLVKPKVED